MDPDIVSSLQSYFGFTGFRPGQVEAIQSLLDNQHTLVVMPTGSGKSLVFQLTALQLPGVTLVISPLIALMKDQVDNLERRGISATFINSTLTGSEQSRRLKDLAEGKYRLVYIAPERLRSVQFLNALQRQKISLLAVDEAHCISEWGHDFRPDYLHIAKFRVALGNPLTAALTATATPQVQDDIARLLGLPQIQRIVTGFNRPNLAFEVRYIVDLPDRLRTLKALFAEQEDGASIIYTGTRRDAEEVAEFVRTVVGINAKHYHAGLPSEERTHVQDAFMAGDISAVAATNAFGMGIDRPDVRQVIHYSLPGSLEAYYQEAGRAGRDGLPARAILLYSPEDRVLQEWFIENSTISQEDLRLLFNALRPASNKPEFITLDDLSCLTSLPEIKVRVGLAELERAGAIEHLGDEGLRMLVHLQSWKDPEIQAVTDRLKQHQRHRKAQLECMIVYAESNSCRRNIILKHFGDPGPAEAAVCCDNCQARQSVQTSANDLGALSQSERAGLIFLDIVGRLKLGVGREKIAQILKGSRAQEILRFGYDKNHYYGKLAVFSLAEIKEMIDQLLKLGYLKVIGGEYPILHLTSQGEAAIQAKAAIPIKLPRQISNQAIERKKAEHQAGGTLEYTAQLLSEGLSVDQIASQRGLTINTIYSHIAKLITAGQVSVDAVIPGDIRQKIEAAIQRVGSVEYLTPIKALLPDEIDYSVIRCVVEGWKRDLVAILGSSPAESLLALDENGHLIPESTDVTELPLPQISPKVEIQHIVVLSEIGSASAISELVAYLQNPYGSVRCLAAFALGKIGDKCATAPLIELLEREEKPQVRQYAVKALGRIGDIQAKLILETIAHNDHEQDYTRKAARLALKRLLPAKKTGITSAEMIQQQPDSPTEDPITAFLSRPHPRQLPGLWSAGWALGFHSQFAGSDWSRSETGELAYRLKYQNDLSVLPSLVEQAMVLIADHPELAQVDAVVPVPPSTPRLHDPVSSFAKALAQRLGLAFLPVLIKSRQTAPQKEMHTLAQKRANVSGAFDLQSPIKGKRLLVVDDLFDSGATLEEITHLLRRAGAARVCVLTLTRTIHSDA
jgi:ATP-dependent DNA helicase RecQ